MGVGRAVLVSVVSWWCGLGMLKAQSELTITKLATKKLIWNNIIPSTQRWDLSTGL